MISSQKNVQKYSKVDDPPSNKRKRVHLDRNCKVETLGLPFGWKEAIALRRGEASEL